MKITLKNISYFKGCMLTCLLFVSSQVIQAQSCDFTTGPVTLNVTGGNQTDSYNSTFILTDLSGQILLVNEDEATFEIGEQGFYTAYAVNYKDDTNVTGLVAGANIVDVSSDNCFDIGLPYGFTVCTEITTCNYCLGETVSLTADGGNTDPAFTTQYVLTNIRGEILLISDTPVFEELEAGVYNIFPINYETAKAIEGLEIGGFIQRVQSGCIEIGTPFIAGVCDQLNPSIFFDLKGCDITRTAILQVGETFDSYTWSTGATTSFIEVSATEPGTYRVTVTLANGCIGVQQQEIVGDEVSRIGDFVWEDTDADGIQGDDEVGINGVTVSLYADFDRNGLPDFPDFPSCFTTTTNNPTTGEPGWYEFTVYQSNYVVGFTAPSGFVATDQDIGDEINDSDINEAGLTGTIAVGRNIIIDNIDAGFRTSAAICGVVWEDSDGDGRRNESDLGVDGVTINLYTADGELVGTTLSTTDTESGEAGTYCFESIAVADYYVEIVLEDGRVLSPGNVVTDEARDSDASGANGPGTTDVISPASGERVQEIADFGIYTGGSVCGVVWIEAMATTPDIFDEGQDSVIANSQVEVINPDTEEVIARGITGDDGRYCISGIPVGSYKLGFRASTSSTGYVQPRRGSDPLIDSDVDNSNGPGMTGVFFVAPIDTIQGVNAGLQQDALPIELVAFTGSWDLSNRRNILDWSTASEINNDFFEVQRVFGNGTEFETIGTVDGSGTTSEWSIYAYSDRSIDRSGTYYYRLKQVDYDQGFDYSDIIAIEVNLNSFSNFSVFPNPANEKASLQLNLDADDYVAIEIVDMTGRVVKSQQEFMAYRGYNEIGVGTKDLPSGSYILNVRIGNETQYELLQIAR